MKPRTRWPVEPRPEDLVGVKPDAVVVVALTPTGHVVVTSPRGPVRFGRHDVRRLVDALRSAQASSMWETASNDAETERAARPR